MQGIDRLAGCPHFDFTAWKRVGLLGFFQAHEPCADSKRGDNRGGLSECAMEPLGDSRCPAYGTMDAGSFAEVAGGGFDRSGAGVANSLCALSDGV